MKHFQDIYVKIEEQKPFEQITKTYSNVKQRKFSNSQKIYLASKITI